MNEQTPDFPLHNDSVENCDTGALITSDARNSASEL
jgi:hypothetical protein